MFEFERKVKVRVKKNNRFFKKALFFQPSDYKIFNTENTRDTYKCQYFVNGFFLVTPLFECGFKVELVITYLHFKVSVLCVFRNGIVRCIPIFPFLYSVIVKVILKMLFKKLTCPLLTDFLKNIISTKIESPVF